MATPWPSGDPRSTAERPDRVVQPTHIAVRYRPREPVSPRTRSAGRLPAVGWVAGWVITGVGVAVVLPPGHGSHLGVAGLSRPHAPPNAGHPAVVASPRPTPCGCSPRRTCHGGGSARGPGRRARADPR